jgi:hypothetical protein
MIDANALLGGQWCHVNVMYRKRCPVFTKQPVTPLVYSDCRKKGSINCPTMENLSGAKVSLRPALSPWAIQWWFVIGKQSNELDSFQSSLFVFSQRISTRERQPPHPFLLGWLSLASFTIPYQHSIPSLQEE